MRAKKKTIFLVDDSEINLAVGISALSELYEVSGMTSADGLLDRLAGQTPDLILLDVEMPGLNGYEAIKILKNNKKTAAIPVIFLAAKNDNANEVLALSLGAVDYIIKPCSKSLLLKRIELHMLVETQRQALVNYNNNLQEMVKAKTKTVVELQNAVLKTMAELVECRDSVTGGHIERTQHYLGILLSALSDSGLYRDEVASWNIELVLQSAQLHDVGKIAIQDSILRKPDKLSDEEFSEIKAHPLYGERVIEKIGESTSEQEFLAHAKILAGTHHEKWDGSGYPNGLQGLAIPLQGRLLAIADVYDALVATDRPYKSAFTHEEAVAMITAESGTHFEPALVDLFVSAAPSFDRYRRSLGDRDKSILRDVKNPRR